MLIIYNSASGGPRIFKKMYLSLSKAKANKEIRPEDYCSMKETYLAIYMAI